MKQTWKKTSHPSSQQQKYYIGPKKAKRRFGDTLFSPGLRSRLKAASCTQRAVVRESSKNLHCGSQQAADCGYETPPNCTAEKSDERFVLDFGVLNFQHFASPALGKIHFGGSGFHVAMFQGSRVGLKRKHGNWGTGESDVLLLRHC